MDQHTISSMIFCSSVKCLQGGCLTSWLQNWKNNVFMPVRNFWNALKQKVMDGFLGRIVTGDETWVYYHQPKTKKSSKEWCHTSSPKPKNFRTQPSAGKVMLTLFWDERGVILEHYMPKGKTLTSATYADLLKITSVLHSSPNDVDVWVQVLCSNMTMLGPILPVQLLQRF